MCGHSVKRLVSFWREEKKEKEKETENKIQDAKEGWLQKQLGSQIWEPVTQSQGSDWEEMGIRNMELGPWINALPNLSDQVTLNLSSLQKSPHLPC